MSERLEVRARGLEPEQVAELERCLAGDAQALERLYRTHVDRVTRVIGRLVGPTPDLEDLVQATFIEALHSLSRFRGEASLTTWIIRIGVHVARHHLRRGVRRKVPLESVPEVALPPVAAASADQVLDDRRVAHRVHSLLDRVSPKKRIALLLHVVEGYSVEEVAALMGAGCAATKSRIWFARREVLKLARRDPVLRELAKDSPSGGTQCR
jgi:RNA polymerase sigma-70 factor, ECF subfamily